MKDAVHEYRRTGASWSAAGTRTCWATPTTRSRTRSRPSRRSGSAARLLCCHNAQRARDADDLRRPHMGVCTAATGQNSRYMDNLIRGIQSSTGS